MNVQGYISKIGVPRTWKTQQGEDRQSYPIEIKVPFINSKGEEKSDELIGEHVAANPDYIKRLQEQMEKGTRMEFQLGFHIREWEGKRFQNIKIYNIQILL